MHLDTGVVTTIAGTGVRGSYDSSVTSATLANLNQPRGLSIRGNLIYFFDSDKIIRKVDLNDGSISLIANNILSNMHSYWEGKSPTLSYIKPQSLAQNGKFLYFIDGNFFIKKGSLKWL